MPDTTNTVPEPTLEQIDQAAAVLAEAVEWAKPPDNEHVSRTAQVAGYQAALRIVITAARARAEEQHDAAAAMVAAADARAAAQTPTKRKAPSKAPKAVKSTKAAPALSAVK